MLSFLYKYFALAITSSALVYFGTPLLNRFLKEDGLAALTGRPSPAGGRDTTAGAMTAPNLTPIRNSHVPATAPSPDTPAGALPTARDDRPDSSSGTKDGRTGAANAPDSPSSLYWGIILRRTRCYNRDGQFLRDLPAGILVEFDATFSSSAGQVAKCRIFYEGRWVDEVIVPLEAMIRFEGSSGEVEPQTLDLVRRYFELKGKLAEFDNRIENLVAESNPHREEYLALNRQAREFREQTEQLTSRRDTATGGERMQMIQQLRSMQPEGVRLQQRLREVKPMHDAWKPPRSMAEEMRQDPSYRKLEEELREITPRARELLGKDGVPE